MWNHRVRFRFLDSIDRSPKYEFEGSHPSQEVKPETL